MLEEVKNKWGQHQLFPVQCNFSSSGKVEQQDEHTSEVKHSSCCSFLSVFTPSQISFEFCLFSSFSQLTPPPITEEEAKRGLLSLLQRGLIAVRGTFCMTFTLLIILDFKSGSTISLFSERTKYVIWMDFFDRWTFLDLKESIWNVNTHEKGKVYLACLQQFFECFSVSKRRSLGLKTISKEAVNASTTQ